MRKKDIQKFSKPREMRPDQMSAKEIASHSSFLTNQRVNDLIQMADGCGFQARSTPCVETCRAYAGSLESLFIQVEPLFDQKTKDDVWEKMRKFYIMFFNIHDKKYQTIKMLYRMLWLLRDIHRIIITHLQHYQYFFRVETPTVKGIANILKMRGWLKDDSDIQGLFDK